MLCAGLLLNNQMDDFSTPEQANAYDVEPSVANYIRPGKKPLSSMSPSILQVCCNPQLPPPSLAGVDLVPKCPH